MRQKKNTMDAILKKVLEAELGKPKPAQQAPKSNQPESIDLKDFIVNTKKYK